MPYQSGPGELVDGVDRGARIAGAPQAPRRCSRVASQVGHRTAHRLGQVLAGDAVMLLLEFADADHEPGNAVGVVDATSRSASLLGIVDIAVGEHGEKRAAQQIGIVRIELEHVEVIGRSGGESRSAPA